MQTPIEFSLVFALLSAAIAGVVVWLLARSRMAVAVQQALSESSARMASSEQELRFAMQESERLRGELAHAENNCNAANKELDALREQRAQLQVHADRVPQLELQLKSVLDNAARQNERMIEINHSDGEKSREIVDLGDRLSRMDGALRQAIGERDAARSEARQQGEALADLKSQVTGLNKRLEERHGEISAMTVQLDFTNTEVRRQIEQIAELTTTLEAERTQSGEKLTLLNEAKEQLTHQFENLANKILEEKGQKFTKQNQENIGLLLSPLNEKIKVFQEQVAQTYDKDSKERLTLKNEIERLATLNTKISADAINLTQALKGSNKAQGIWGEMVLERVLESSGLTRGREYEIQENHTTDEGGRQHPDVVIYLPENKHLVIDSKMSLLAYERYCSAESDAERAIAQRDHLISVRAHVKGLSEKNYQNLKTLKSLDFVVMFIPIEPAFMLAATADQALFSEAFDKNVLLVSPSTLLATLRTIANIWRQEYQNKNAQAIADQCAKLYDKFVGFVESLEDIGNRLKQAQKSYDDAYGKLSSGRGNLIGQAEKIKDLGVKPSKQLPSGFLTGSEDYQEPALN
ncbi:MAG: DNA recombination protein RmuC [Azonexus sp.]|jgi:DNA recombination protein RmuC|nr:DNA recombination protein RmuC [Azonexus sp.]